MIKKIKPGDAIILAAIAFIAGVLFVLSLMPERDPDRPVALVRVNGGLVASLPLDHDAECHTGSLTVAVSGGTARAREASCPDKLCQRQGGISRPGQTIVCLPARTTITISGKPEIDGVSR
ncbi:MAG: NusG domain II-containing protein [Oscillospiraceae bacterium]|nr:NusG domain II-containing protein [Oscillospiraceae bacterium]